MTKTKGVPLPDPKEWKWCEHPECMEKAQIESGFGVGGEREQALMREEPHLCARYDEEYCWKHLSEKAESLYEAKIEKWMKDGRSLAGANLIGIRLQKAFLWHVNLQGANLQCARLQEAGLRFTQLQGADLRWAKLQGANLMSINLQRVNFCFAEFYRTNLRGTNLQEADLRYANLQEANLSGANLREAYLSNARLRGTFLHGVLLDGALELTWKQVERVGEEKNENWKGARDAYRRLKNYFHQQGRYDDESQAYYREKLMAKHEAHEQCFKQKHPKSFFNWFGLWLLWAVAGFGERWMRIIPWGAGILLFFTGLYFLGSNLGWGAPYDHPTLLSIGNLFDCFVFSVVTFVTLGFGKIWTSAWLTKALIILEAGLGFVFLGMFVVLIARKFGR
ncbi:hypothetical protein CEE36_06975 [candidate division TA06 bacterium B3_TA06]|uniref:Potassium channel domain-containing protein n=1 Tax=candidate division TA06 bacterium B3_TA06 TaxID=2012487 RepID=A0A532V6P6_UNCT6|nr:MAG: hypothetical protein CEE36_06975 [candidate division TA06 bacterium B3_TA06]